MGTVRKRGRDQVPQRSKAQKDVQTADSASGGSPPRIESWADRVLGPVPNYPMPEGLSPDTRAQVVLWSAAVLMVLLIFQGGLDLGDLNPAWSEIRRNTLAARMYWVAWGAFAYLVAPVAIILLVMRESPARYGFRIYVTRRTALVYAGLLLVMLMPVLWASQRPSFIQKYPLVTDLGGDWTRILTWELIRSLRFVCLEFFFRGYLLFGLEKRFGYHAIAVAALPYGVIHYSKPFPEAIGAVAAGAVLGFLALRTRSIAGGAFLHATVAMAIDLLALYQKGALE